MELNLSEKYHLYRRACFFTHEKDMQKENNANKLIDKLFNHQKIVPLKLDLPDWKPEFIQKSQGKKGKELREKWKEQVKALNQIWLQQMLQENVGLQEKMTLFWHGHFACDTSENPYESLSLNNIIRDHALGSFRDLLFAVTKNVAMINYLHLKQNKKGSPNEDFARELCELFTLGRDIDYSETDVKEIARAFTGWQYDEYGNHIVVARLHDSEVKTIFGKTGNFGGEDVLEMLLSNKNTAIFICRKVYRFFVREKENPEHIAALAEHFYAEQYSIQSLMKFLFSQKWFYAAQGEIILSPIEFMVVLGKIFDLKYGNNRAVIHLQYYLGQILFKPPNVAGWPGGRHWIDASRLALRLRLGSLIINKGYLEDELSPELDAMIAEKQKNKAPLEFFETIDWSTIYTKNSIENLFDLLIASGNEELRLDCSEMSHKEIIQLISTPDFQLT